LNEVLDDREGLPITLSIVYMELARRLGLKVEGVALPGHFIVQYFPAEGEARLIDVYEGATVVSRDEANRRVKEATERDLTDEDLKPPTKRAIVARMLHNLLGVSGGEPGAMRRYLNAIVAIEPESAEHRWLRAIVDYRLEDFAAASVDVEWLLDHEPAGIDLERVRELQRVLKLQEEGR
jgi:regulator of sirC expression with transglutaminase-like and TPR domain